MDKSVPVDTRQIGDMRDALAFAIADGNASEVKKLIETEPLLLNEPIPSQNNKTPLHLAALAGSESIVLYLLENGADPYMMDDEGQLPQDIAQSIGAGTQVVEMLRVR